MASIVANVLFKGNSYRSTVGKDKYHSRVDWIGLVSDCQILSTALYTHRIQRREGSLYI